MLVENTDEVEENRCKGGNKDEYSGIQMKSEEYI